MRLLTPKWLLLHVLVAVLFVATFFLGYWQLTKAEAGGGAVNWSYALQWPLYGFMGLWFYIRMVRDRAAPRPRRGRAGPGRRPVPAAADRHHRRPRAGRLQRLPRRAQRARPGPTEQPRWPLSGPPLARRGSEQAVGAALSATGSWPTSSASC